VRRLVSLRLPPEERGGGGEYQLLECIKELLRIDKEWIPTQKGYSMYLRPVMFSTTPWLGLTQCR
jgi:hypothetical protein